MVFAALWPTSLAFCVQFFVGRHVDGGRSFTGGQIALRTVVVGVLASVGTFILPLPATVSGSLSGSTVVGGVVYALELLALSVVAVAVMFAQWRRLRSPSRPPLGPGGVILGYAAVYLAVMTVLWLTALPDWFGAVGGVTADGDPIGSLWYTVLCLMVAALALAAAVTVRPVASATAEAAESTQAQPQA